MLINSFLINLPLKTKAIKTKTELDERFSENKNFQKSIDTEGTKNKEEKLNKKIDEILKTKSNEDLLYLTYYMFGGGVDKDYQNDINTFESLKKDHNDKKSFNLLVREILINEFKDIAIDINIKEQYEKYKKSCEFESNKYDNLTREFRKKIEIIISNFKKQTKEIKNNYKSPLDESIILNSQIETSRGSDPIKLENIKSFDKFDNRTEGKFKFCINKNYEIYIGYDNDSITHDVLAVTDKEVKAAGIITVKNGCIESISNYSGHYKPAPVNSIYAFNKIAEKLGLNRADYDVLVGLNHSGGSFDGYSSPVLVIAHKNTPAENIDYHMNGKKIFYKSDKGLLVKTFDFQEFYTKEYKNVLAYIKDFKLWKMRMDNIYNNLENDAQVNEKHELCIFLNKIIGFSAEEVKTIIQSMPQGRTEM